MRLTTHHLTNKVLIVVLFLTLTSLITFLWYNQHYINVFFFSIGRNKNYTSLNKSILQLEDKKDIRMLNHVEATLIPLLKLYPDDPILLFYYGKVQYLKFCTHIDKKPVILTDVFLLSYSYKTKYHSLVNQSDWIKSTFYIRRSLILGLPDLFLGDAINILVYLYIFGGELYRDEINRLTNTKERRILLKQDTRFLLDIFQLKKPDWSFTRNFHSQELGSLFKVLYNLKIGNVSLAISLLRNIIKKKSVSVDIKNNAYYILGNIVQRNNKKQQMYYYNKVEAKEFLQRYPHFIQEYSILLTLFQKHQLLKKILILYK